MTRATHMEVEARTMVEAVGLEMVRSDIKRMARATFDLKLGDRTLAQGLIISEIVAAVTVLNSLNQDNGSEETDPAAASTETETEATATSEPMPVEE